MACDVAGRTILMHTIIAETPAGPTPIESVDASTAGFAGETERGPTTPEAVASSAEFGRIYGEAPSVLARMVRGFFDNGGTRAYVARASEGNHSEALARLEAVDGIALLCPLPQDTVDAIAQCERARDRVAIVSMPAGLADVDAALAARPSTTSAFAAVHYPWVRVDGELTPPGGHVAGVYAHSALAHAPTDVELRGLDADPLERRLSDREIALLVQGAVDPLRDLRAAGRGVRIWAARTLGIDPEWHQLPSRRLGSFVETSIRRGLRWVAFERNGEALWEAVRGTVSDFLTRQWRAGTLQGTAPQQAFFVRCDRSTMTQADLDEGRLVCLVGIAPTRPAEFVIFRFGLSTARP